MSQGHSTSRYPIHTNPIGACISLFKDEKPLNLKLKLYTIFGIKEIALHQIIPYQVYFFILFYKKVFNEKPSDYRG